MADLERSLYVVDKTAKEYKKSDDLRKKLYKAFLELSYRGAAKINVIKILNDAFYLLARLYEDEMPEEDIYKNYVYFLPGNSDGILGESEENKLTMIVMYAVLVLQKKLPDNIQEFLPYFKDIVSQYPFFEKAESQINIWIEKYGLFETDFAPNPSAAFFIKNYDVDSDDRFDSSWQDTWGQLYDAFFNNGVVKYIKRFRAISEQADFYEFVYDRIVPNLDFRYEMDGVKVDTSAIKEASAAIIDEINNGVYLPEYDFPDKSDTLEIDVDESSQNEEGLLIDSATSAELLLVDNAEKDEKLAEKDREIEELIRENNELKNEIEELKNENTKQSQINQIADGLGGMVLQILELPKDSQQEKPQNISESIEDNPNYLSIAEIVEYANTRETPDKKELIRLMLMDLCDLSDVKVSEMINSLDKYAKTHKKTKKQAKKNDNPVINDVLSYVTRLNSIVAKDWKDKINKLWQAIVEVQKIKSELMKKGKQQGTTFNRNFVARIIKFLMDKNVYVETTDVNLALLLEKSKNHSIRSQFCKLESSYDEAVQEVMNSF